MKITFDLRKTGLGNNGGSFTLIKSGNTLKNMGHDVIFIDSGRNQHTWVKLETEHRIVKNRKTIPHADFIISTGYNSVSETIIAPDYAGIKAHWIRGFELWKGNEEWIIKNILKAPTLKLVNGVCLQEKLKKLGYDSYLIRPGYDFDKIKHINSLREKNKYIVIGGLNKQGKHSNSKRTTWIFETAKVLKKKYGSDKIKLWMFGMDNLPKTSIVDYYVKNPSDKEKNFIFNNCDIWLATSMLEGLHMPPAEAMMTECPVVGTNAEMSGTKDYLINEETGIVTQNNLSSFVEGVERLFKNNDLRKRLGRNAKNKIFEIGTREKNMRILINIFNQLKMK